MSDAATLTRDGDAPTDDVVQMKAAIARLKVVAEDLNVEIDGLRDELADAEAVRDDYNDQLEDVGRELDEALARANEIDAHKQTLVEVRGMIRCGNTDEALYQLETVLGHLDSAWRARA